MGFFFAAAVATTGFETAAVGVVERKDKHTFEDQKAVVNSVCIFLSNVSTENVQF